MSNDENFEICKVKPTKFPPLLSEINDPPKELYVRGTYPLRDDLKYLCVVGARKFTDYGRSVCEELIAGLANYPVGIISGLALGIDSIAHKAALAAKLYTIAVPGSGIDSSAIYPATHRQLAERILESGGTILSEFEPKLHAAPWTFPQRNRIMAGLSHAILVIEAEKKSGTLITARLAAEYNRDVFVVPGSIHSRTSEGPHLLLRLGATPITKSADILDALNILPIPGVETPAKNYSDCSPQEQKVIGLLRSPMPRDELIRALGLNISEANALLSLMEIKDLIKEEMGEIRLR
jgi:DNA processing protein